jgi:dinuclear metal center YbgI/SA1388 family protein
MLPNRKEKGQRVALNKRIGVTWLQVRLKMRIEEVISYLEQWAPPILQESYDNSGLLVGNQQSEITNVLVSLDCTEDIVEEAIAKNCNLIVSHHPIVFNGLKRFTGEDYVQRTVIKAIQNNIALYAIHTNLDNTLEGVNGEIARRLGLKNIRPLIPFPGLSNQSLIENSQISNQNIPQFGSGAIGELDSPISLLECLGILKKEFNNKCIKYTSTNKEFIQKIAVCGGSGQFLLGAAKSLGADVFITSDVKYHEFFDAENQLSFIDIGHFESEQFTIDLIHAKIIEKFRTFAVHKTGVITNPVLYY